MTRDDERYGTYDSAVVPNNAEENSYMIPIVLEPRPYSVPIIHIVAVLFARIMVRNASLSLSFIPYHWVLSKLSA